MSPIERFWTVLNKLQKQCSVTLSVKRTKDSLIINGIVFKRLSRLGLIKFDLPSNAGIMINKITPDEEKHCRSNNVSFLTSNGRLYLVSKNYKLNLELAPRQKAESKQKRLKIGKQSGLPAPTALISPNALDILDVLFRLAPENLEKFKSALGFANEFHLSQPKLSLMMKELNANSIVDLKNKIKLLPDSWWESSLRYSLTKKGLLPFFESEKIHRSIKTDLTKDQIADNLKYWLCNDTKVVLHGPVEIAKIMGLIRDDDIYLWCTPASARDIKNSFKLIPDRKIQETNWHIAVSPVDLGKGAILSPLANRPTAFYLPEINTNLFRAIWDLGFGSERLQEVQLLALRRVLDAV